MTAPAQLVRWHTFPDATAVANEASRRILAAAHEAIAARGVFRLVLAGGGTPEAAYRLLASAPADWARWEIFYGDERCLPADHADRNSRMAARAWLDHVDIPAARIHDIPAELGADMAARRYADVVKDVRPFDLVLLGLGEDGHTASLFPGHVHAVGELVHAVREAPKPPPDRVSLSAEVLSDARAVLLMACGAGKREAIRRWRDGEALPVATLRPATGLDVLLDAAAART